MVKQQIKEFLDSTKWEKFRQEYEASDDRSCALLCAAYLDNCLEILVLEALPHEKQAHKNLFSETKPLRTFSAKIEIAFCLGLIPKSFYDDLNSIRKIRNDFAHKLHGLKFSTEPVKSWCENLTLPVEHSKSLGYTIDETCSREPRQKFIFAAAILSMLFEDYYLERARKIRSSVLLVEPKID